MKETQDPYVGKRVRVMAGDGVTPLGFGIYQGSTQVQIARSDSHTLSHSDNSDFTPEEQTELKSKGFNSLERVFTPEIKMENGTIVYGCQVWWELDEETLP